MAVIVEDADIPRNDIAGGRLAAPIARAVMEAAIAVSAERTTGRSSARGTSQPVPDGQNGPGQRRETSR